MPALTAVGSWSPAPPPVPRHLLVVAPHPDDEVLGAAGVMRWAADSGAVTTIVGCTDGEASHRRSRLVTPDELRTRRQAERSAALSILALDVEVHRLGLPDGDLAAHEAELAEGIRQRCGRGTTVLVPSGNDGHPDHEAAFRAGRAAAAAAGADLWQVPIWAKVRRPDPQPGRLSALRLSPWMALAKAEAIAAFASQVEPLGALPEDGPVVHADELAHMLDGIEAVVW